IALLTANLPLGYNRDLQLLKDIIFPAVSEIIECLDMATFMLPQMKVRADILDDPRYDYLFTVEEVNRLVLDGMPFREAYKKVGQEVQQGTYSPVKEVHHTHLGSISNPANDRISTKFHNILKNFEL
ncbi:MAG: argininosuccinate lyase, partial [Duncaniella sp.]|nr:argininosuccinate lyase [Duncaniella sp.]